MGLQGLEAAEPCLHSCKRGTFPPWHTTKRERNWRGTCHQRNNIYLNGRFTFNTYCLGIGDAAGSNRELFMGENSVASQESTFLLRTGRASPLMTWDEAAASGGGNGRGSTPANTRHTTTTEAIQVREEEAAVGWHSIPPPALRLIYPSPRGGEGTAAKICRMCYFSSSWQAPSFVAGWEGSFRKCFSLKRSSF